MPLESFFVPQFEQFLYLDVIALILTDDPCFLQEPDDLLEDDLEAVVEGLEDVIAEGPRKLATKLSAVGAGVPLQPSPQ